MTPKSSPPFRLCKNQQKMGGGGDLDGTLLMFNRLENREETCLEELQ